MTPVPGISTLSVRSALLALVAIASLCEPARGAISVAIDPALDRRPVSPWIYGVNFGSSVEFADLPYPLRRWGGNAVTRYSWTQDTHNSGSDWFFISTPSSHPNPALLPNGSEADLFVGETRTAGADVIVTVPTIGWSPKDRQKRWSFSVSKYGAQQSDECVGSGGAWWCQPDAGNGVLVNGTRITGNDPADTSVPIGGSYVGDWVAHLMGQFGSAATGGVRFYALDNEPTLWHETHRDVHPAPLTYDELWSRTLDYAGRIKLEDPAATVMGPVCWGWCDYFYSAADGCASGPDRAAHGDLPLLEWYLAQVEAHRIATGTRLVDLLDVHYYPQAGTALNDDESAATARKRLRTVKSLYDPAYVDESWIGQPVRLIPRLRAMIDTRAPGLGIAITEYHFGGDHGISSALAQAEVLAVFGREGVDLATRWVAPQSGSRCQDAFRMYLNYDGAGAQVSGTSVRATSALVDSVGAYAIEAPDGRHFALLFNKHTAGETVALTLTGGGDRDVSLYRFTASTAWGPAGTASVTAGSMVLALPARSATLAVIAAPTTAVGGEPRSSTASLSLRCAPNPTWESASIEFSLPQSGRVDLGLYDVAGRLVRTLAAGDFAGGAHRIVWDGRDGRGLQVPAGRYVLRLSALDDVESTNLVRVRSR